MLERVGKAEGGGGMKVTVKKLSALTPLRKNVRRHNDKQIGEYVRSLEMFGQIRPMVVDECGVILVGNGMYEAMKRMGAETADCYVIAGLTEARKSKLMLADNRVYELGMTDMDAFEEIISDLAGDFDIPGWDADLLETLSASAADADELVQRYGTYAPDDVQRMRERQNAPADAPVSREASNAPLQRPSGATDGAGLLPDRTEAPPARDAVEAAVGRYVICPHCGERIVIEPSMIGGE